MLLLDTHVWLWSADGDTRRVGRRARQALAKAESGDDIRISPVTIFEVTALHTLGRLRLARPLDQWVHDSLDAAGVRIAELTPAIAIDAGAIPRVALADPLDRLLVATARQLDAVFLTADTRILEYAARTKNLHAQDASTSESAFSRTGGPKNRTRLRCQRPATATSYRLPSYRLSRRPSLRDLASRQDIASGRPGRVRE